MLLLVIVLGCGNDRRAPTSSAEAGAAGAPGEDDLCQADCAAQEQLDCVDPSTCLERCENVYELVGDQGCAPEYTAMLSCVAEQDREPYLCLDDSTFGFDESSPCFQYSKTLSECLQQ